MMTSTWLILINIQVKTYRPMLSSLLIYILVLKQTIWEVWGMDFSFSEHYESNDKSTAVFTKFIVRSYIRI